MLYSQGKNRRCAQCWRPMILIWQNNQWVLKCPNNCTPGGHVSESYVDNQRAKDTYNAARVLSQYPSLQPDKLTKKQMDDATNALYGED